MMHGIVIQTGQKVAYIYLCGIKPVRAVSLTKHVTLMPVKSTPDPDDMIDNIMKYGCCDEFMLGILISTLRRVTAELKICVDDEKELAINTWNAQTLCVQISAIFNCEVAWYFQSNETVENFNSRTHLHLIYPNMLKFPDRLTILDEEKCCFLEKNITKAMDLDCDARYSHAANALWCHRFHPRPAIRMSIIWGGIESLFLIEKNIKKNLSVAISRFLFGDDRIAEKVRLLYEKRSKAVHELNNCEDYNLTESVELLHNLILQCIKNDTFPCVEELLK